MKCSYLGNLEYLKIQSLKRLHSYYLLDALVNWITLNYYFPDHTTTLPGNHLSLVVNV